MVDQFSLIPVTAVDTLIGVLGCISHDSVEVRHQTCTWYNVLRFISFVGIR